MEKLNEILKETKPFINNYFELKEYLLKKYQKVSVNSLEMQVAGIEQELKESQFSKEEISENNMYINVIKEIIEQKK